MKEEVSPIQDDVFHRLGHVSASPDRDEANVGDACVRGLNVSKADIS